MLRRLVPSIFNEEKSRDTLFTCCHSQRSVTCSSRAGKSALALNISRHSSKPFQICRKIKIWCYNNTRITNNTMPSLIPLPLLGQTDEYTTTISTREADTDVETRIMTTQILRTSALSWPPRMEQVLTFCSPRTKDLPDARTDTPFTKLKRFLRPAFEKKGTSRLPPAYLHS